MAKITSQAGNLTTDGEPLVQPCDLEPAPWARQIAGGTAQRRQADTVELTVTPGSAAAALISARLVGAAALDVADFQKGVTNCYRQIAQAAGALGQAHPVRFWNYLPAIHQQMDDRRDRYMVFNEGRYTAWRQWFGEPGEWSGRLPAASGIGHAGDDLVIHCLALDRPGVGLENPRQTPTYRYSHRYGPRPPCFARAMLIDHPLDHRPALLISGTASIRGEKSVHVDDLRNQLAETRANLQALLAAAGKPSGVPNWALTELRVYHVRGGDAAAIHAFVRGHLAPSARLQLRQAVLCRADLRVEIEGLARPEPTEGG